MSRPLNFPVIRRPLNIPKIRSLTEISLVVVEIIVPGGGRKPLVAKGWRNHEVVVIICV